MSIDREEHRLYNHPMSILLINVFLALSLLFSAFPVFAQPSSQSSDASRVTDNSVIENDSGTETPATEIKAEKVEPLTIEEGLSAGGKKVIKAIEVKGNRTISLSTILAKIKSRVGQEYLQGIISDDIKRLYNTGYFSDVHVDKDSYEGGYKVFFFVTEKPIVEEITFSSSKGRKGSGVGSDPVAMTKKREEICFSPTFKRVVVSKEASPIIFTILFFLKRPETPSLSP